MINIQPTNIFERLQMILKLRDIKLNDFLAKMDLSRQSVYNWKGKSCPSADTAYAICKELNISMDWFITGDTDQDTTEADSPAQIVNRIHDKLERLTQQKEYDHDDTFYSCLKGIIEPHELGDWFHGWQKPSLNKLLLIAERLGEDFQYLVSGTLSSDASRENERKEDNLLRAYNSLDAEHRKAVSRQIDFNLRDQYGTF